MKSIGLLLVFMFAAASFAFQQDVFQVVQPQQASAMLAKDNNLLVLDLRSPNDYAQGHIKNALNVDENENNFLERLDRLNKGANYIVYSGAGTLNDMAIHYMRENNFTGKIYNMAGGFEGWINSNLPVER